MNPHEPSTTFDVASFDADALKARDHARCDATYLRATLIRNTGKAPAAGPNRWHEHLLGSRGGLQRPLGHGRPP